MQDKQRNSRVDNWNNDGILSDPLPQPYRFINKLLLQVIEESCDLAEDGGVTDSNDAFICRNLRLTKVGRVPLTKMESFTSSIDISQYEVTSYSYFANTSYVMLATSQGNIIIHDFSAKNTLLNFSIGSLNKNLQSRPINHIISLASDYGNYAVVFISEETCYLVLFTNTFTMKWSTEIDISEFFLKSIRLIKCEQSIVICDGNGKLQVFSCKTPADMTPDAAAPNARGAQNKQAPTLEPLLEIEKCPITAGPVQSQSPPPPKTAEESVKKKVPPKKKAPPPPKGKNRPKSPQQEVVPETPEVINNFHPRVCIFGNTAVIIFGDFPILQLYSLEGEKNLICEFPLPSQVTSYLEVQQSNTLIVGFENGTFCFLSLTRRALYGHQFLKHGKITDILLFDNCLVVCTSLNFIAAYRLDGMKASEQIYTCSDDDIIAIKQCGPYIATYNKMPSDLSIRQSLSCEVDICGMTTPMIPNISILDAATGKYIGSASSPSNLQVETQAWGPSSVITVYTDPNQDAPKPENKDENAQKDDSQKTDRDTMKTDRKNDKKNEKKPQKKLAKKEEVVEENAAVIKKQIIGFADLNAISEQLIAKIKEFEMATQSFCKTHSVVTKSNTPNQ